MVRRKVRSYSIWFLFLVVMIILPFVGLRTGAAQTSQPGNILGWYYYGLARFQSYVGDTNSAIFNYTTAVEIDTDFAAAYLRRGNLYYKMGGCQEAREDYSRYLDLTGSADGYVNRGAANACLGNVEIAMQDIDQALAIAPDHLRALIWKGEFYFSQGNYAAAITEFSKVLQIAPENRFGLVYRAHSYYAVGEFQYAVDDYSKIIQLNASDSLGYIGRAMAYSALGEYSQAIPDYDMALKLNPAWVNGNKMKLDAVHHLYGSGRMAP